MVWVTLYTDADVVVRTHVQRTVSRCSAVLRQLRQIRHSVPTDTFQTLVVSLVTGRPASVYCYFVLFLLLLYDTVCEVYK